MKCIIVSIIIIIIEHPDNYMNFLTQYLSKKSENTVRNHCCTISKQVKVVNIVNHWTVLSCPFEGSL